MTPRSPSSRGSVTAMAEAARVMTLKVPTTLSSWMNLNALEVVGRVVAVDDPTHPSRARTVDGDAQLPALGRLVDGALAVVGVGDVAGHVVGVGADVAGHFLGAVLVAVEDRAPHALGREGAGRALTQP